MLFIFLLIAVCLILLLIFMLLPGRSTPQQRHPFWGLNIAHRGLHSKDQTTPENSLAAFEAACQAGYGIELDVQLSKDGQVMVFHDDTLQRACNITERVDNYTAEELQQTSLFSTAHTIPLFKDVLNTVQGRVPLVVELKRGPQNALLCQKTWQLLQQYPGPYCIESFDPRIVGWFRKQAPSVLRGQLAATPKALRNGASGFLIGNLLSNFIARPQFIAYDKANKTLLARLISSQCMQIAWTVRPENDIKAIEQINDAIIFEYYAPPVYYKTQQDNH